MKELIDINMFPVRNVLKTLLQDKTTGKNIIFATDNYLEYGCTDTDQITENALLGFASIDLQPRVLKAQSEQSERTRKKAEVFTPTWICNFMNNHCDEVWFDKANVFNKQAGESWKPVNLKIPFKKPEDWQAYILSRRLEITCGEAPFLVTRYDATTGEPLPVPKRVGLLDRKLRVVNENAVDEAEWWEWTVKAYESTYGYEFQGDNLLIARINLLITFCDNLEHRWQRKPTEKEIKYIANVITWNIWQMDGLKEIVPVGIPCETEQQLSFFEEEKPEISVQCKVFDWRGRKPILFSVFKKREVYMKFDFVIGNPPYQEEYNGQSTGANSIYHLFMDASYAISDKVMLITPARFLFNAGSTPKQWNNRMLNDPHLKVCHYESDCSVIFSNVDIKGGVAVTYHDVTQDFGAIEIFTPYELLNTAFRRVASTDGFVSISSVIVTSFAYHFTNVLYEQKPFLRGRQSKGHDFDLKSNVFEKMPEIFFAEKPDDGENYIRILGRANNQRTYRFVNRRFVNNVSNLDSYKLFFAKAAGNGSFGEVFPPSIIGQPADGSTETFLSIGAFSTIEEAKNAQKYICTKFARAMLGVLKITQDVTPEKWKFVPLQDFTPISDIDWSKSISEIDRQLYAKYGLTREEIAFIESHVKEME